MINLTYTHGKEYRVTPVIYRQTEITFLCDHHAGIGHPTFTEESNHAYSFEWFTSYACPNSPVECTVTDTVRHKQYDLSRYGYFIFHLLCYFILLVEMF